MTEGTEVAATAVFVPSGPITFQQEFPVVTPRQDIGLGVERHPGVVTQNDWTMEIPFNPSFQQVMYALESCLKKVATSTGTFPEKTFSYAPAANLADPPNPFTGEIRFTDGTNNIDYTYTGLIGTEIELSAALAGITEGRWRLFARSENTNALTGALTAPATLDIPAGNLWRLTTGNSFANIGSTNVTGQLYGWTWTHTTPWSPAHYMDGALGPSRKRANMRGTRLRITMDQEASAGFAANLRLRLVDRALVPLRLTVNGPVINTPNTMMINIDGMYTVESWGAPQDHDGEDSVEVELMARYDPTGAQDVRVNVLVNINTLV